MASVFWTASESEIPKSSNWESRKEFLSEARMLLDTIVEKLSRPDLHFSRDDRSPKRALFMLLLDAVDTLRNCVELMKQQQCRIVGKMLRDIYETLSLVHLFWDEGVANQPAKLKRWYDNRFVMHKDYRAHLKKKDEALEEFAKRFYEYLSKPVHHTYDSLLLSYWVNDKDELVHDICRTQDLTGTLVRLSMLDAKLTHFGCAMALLTNMTVHLLGFTGLVPIPELSRLYESATGTSIQWESPQSE